MDGVTVASYGGTMSLERLIVERVPDPAVIPLPAGAWLPLSGLGALGLARVSPGRAASRSPGAA